MRATQLLSGLAAAALLASCGKDVAPPQDLTKCDGLCGDGPLLALRTVNLTQADAEGRVPGFNLDGTDGPQSFDCSASDFVGVDGTPGIDNQVAALFPVLKELIGEALPTLLQNSVNEGGLSIITEFVGLDDPQNDSDVKLVLHRGVGTLLLDAEGKPLAGQSHELAKEPPLGVCENGKLVNGKLTCSGFKMRLVVVVFGVTYDLLFHDVRLEMQLSPDLASSSILIGGSISTDDIYRLADTIGEVGPKDIIKDAVPPFADIEDPTTGACNRISGALLMTSQLAFVYR